MTEQNYDRRNAWTPKPRPEWMATLNEIGRGLDMKSILPLSPDSLINEVVRKTGLQDFGDDGWEQHFRVLLEAIDKEADLHFAGRLLARTEFLNYLEARLRIEDWFHRFPQTNDEIVDSPVFITGYGRSGTTILFEVLSQDPQFRVAQKWEGMYPCPAPQKDTYSADPRIAQADNFNYLYERMVPEFVSQHKGGGDLPIESLELEYATFLSDVYPILFQIPSYAKYLAEHDMRASFAWKKRLLKLLQSKYRKPHWLMKSPSHLWHLSKLLDVFPDMKFIFTHRDPLVSADSIVSVMGTLYWQRTDNPWGNGSVDSQSLALGSDRARVWDGVIDLIEQGRIAKGRYANFHYHQFMADPMATVQNVYNDLEMILEPEIAAKMTAFLDHKFQGKFGKHDYAHAPADAILSERRFYKHYQDYFSVPSEM